ncbi:hypothetical protein [Belliella pelovolcani]|uniref:hypothetical protein n=1 Tax=Belliella pelovolcani TaxID=529505 RepID=UPI00391D3F71
MLLLSKTAQQSTALSLSSSINYSITKNRLKMMTIKTDKVKSIFLRSYTAALSMIVLLCFTSSVQSFQMPHMLTFDPSSEKYERIIKEALKYNDPYVLELKNLDIKNLKSAYDQMSEEEKGNISEFPFLSPETFPKLMELYQASDKINVTFHCSRPITKKSIKAEVWDYWQESKKIDYEIDDVEIGSEIGNYSKEDFALYQVIEIESKGLLKKPEYLVKLTTHDYYQKKYIEVKKELNTIQADYPTGDNLNIFYFMRKVSFSVNSKEVKHFPNETELFSELILQ